MDKSIVSNETMGNRDITSIMGYSCEESAGAKCFSVLLWQLSP